MKLINNIRRFGENISRWFSCCPVLWKVYDFDYSSILSVERHQIKRVRYCISHFRNHVNWEQDVASMNLALKLLDIIEGNGEAELLCYEPFIPNDKVLYEPNPDAKWKLERYVNTKNAARFNPQTNRNKYPCLLELPQWQRPSWHWALISRFSRKHCLSLQN